MARHILGKDLRRNNDLVVQYLKTASNILTPVAAFLSFAYGLLLWLAGGHGQSEVDIHDGGGQVHELARSAGENLATAWRAMQRMNYSFPILHVSRCQFVYYLILCSPLVFSLKGRGMCPLKHSICATTQ